MYHEKKKKAEDITANVRGCPPESERRANTAFGTAHRPHPIQPGNVPEETDTDETKPGDAMATHGKYGWYRDRRQKRDNNVEVASEGHCDSGEGTGLRTMSADRHRHARDPACTRWHLLQLQQFCYGAFVLPCCLKPKLYSTQHSVMMGVTPSCGTTILGCNLFRHTISRNLLWGALRRLLRQPNLHVANVAT